MPKAPSMIEIPSYLMHESDPKPIESAILAKLEDLENLEWEIKGVDNILVEQTVTIRSARPASALAYEPKIRELEEKLKELKQQEKEKMDQQRNANEEIASIRESDARVKLAAQKTIDDFITSLSNRETLRGSVNNGKIAISASQKEKYNLKAAYELYKTEKNVEGRIAELQQQNAEAEKQITELEQSYFQEGDAEQKRLRKVQRICNLYEDDIATMQADIGRQENFLNLYQSKAKELEFKRMVEQNKAQRRELIAQESQKDEK